jgi:hypothetical protein
MKPALARNRRAAAVAQPPDPLEMRRPREGCRHEIGVCGDFLGQAAFELDASGPHCLSKQGRPGMDKGPIRLFCGATAWAHPNARGPRMDRYLVGGYDSAVGGHFRRHRDDVNVGAQRSGGSMACRGEQCRMVG